MVAQRIFGFTLQIITKTMINKENKSGESVENSDSERLDCRILTQTCPNSVYFHILFVGLLQLTGTN